MASVLVVEDDGAIRRGLEAALRSAGHGVHAVGDGETGLTRALQGSFDLVVLDRVLPGRDGIEVLRELRRSAPLLPVILLTAVAAEEDRVAGLRAGADDYVVKPFGLQELLARIEAVLRRSPARPTDLARVEVPGACIDFALCEVRFQDGTRAALAPREAALVRYLACNASRVVPRDELLAQVWRDAVGGVTGRAVDMQVARLREKLRDLAEEPRILLTVRGSGYRLAIAP